MPTRAHFVEMGGTSRRGKDPREGVGKHGAGDCCSLYVLLYYWSIFSVHYWIAMVKKKKSVNKLKRNEKTVTRTRCPGLGRGAEVELSALY